MGKRIIQQRRGRGTSTYRVKKKSFVYRVQYPKFLEKEGTVIKIFSSAAHGAPLAKISHKGESFYIPAFKKMVEGQKISFEVKDAKKINDGTIASLKDLPVKTKIYCIESHPGDGGKFIKSAGNDATINKVIGDNVFVLMPSKKEKKFHPNCRAIVGTTAGGGLKEKPILKAGKQFYIKKSKSKLWPRTSAIKMNAIDHPFGGGRGKNPKSKIAQRNAPPGQKVGLLRPRRTGKRK